MRTYRPVLLINVRVLLLPLLDPFRWNQVPDVDYIVVPVGGAGLIAGIALATKTLQPEVKVREGEGSREREREEF